MAFKVKTQKGEGDWRPYPLVSRCALCILAMITIDCIVTIMAITKRGKFVDHLLLYFVVLSLCWTTFFLLRPIFRPSVLHPGWAVGLDLICFPMVGTWSIIGAIQAGRRYVYLGACWGYDVYRHGECRPYSSLVLGLDWLAYISGFFITIIHLVLFVLACRDVRRYNREKKHRNSSPSVLKLKEWSSSPYLAINASEEHIPRVALQPDIETENFHGKSHSRNHSRTHSRSHSRSDSRRVSVFESTFGNPEHGVLEVEREKRPNLGFPSEV